MLPYWLMFIVPAAVASLEEPVEHIRTRPVTLDWVVVWLCTALLVGLRYRVGGDWFNYLRYLVSVQGLQLSEVLTRSDPAYELLNWVFADEGWGIYGVNLLGGLIFASGLILFCLHQPRPWLALAVSIPYLVIVVGMGYTRQGIALALEMMGLVALSNRSTALFVIFIAVAGTFHKSAVLLLPIAALAATRNRVWTTAWIAAALALLYYLLLSREIENLYINYVEAEYQSEGALVRLAMNGVAAAIFLGFGKKFDLSPAEWALWRWFAVFSFILLGVLAATPSSTAVDRVALYLLPLQLVVFSRLPDALSSSRFGFAQEGRKGIITFAVLLYYGIVQFVWLNYAANAKSWLPYRFYAWGTVL